MKIKLYNTHYLYVLALIGLMLYAYFFWYKVTILLFLSILGIVAVSMESGQTIELIDDKLIYKKNFFSKNFAYPMSDLIKIKKAKAYGGIFIIFNEITLFFKEKEISFYKEFISRKDLERFMIEVEKCLNK